jgi:hypothetical protein
VCVCVCVCVCVGVGFACRYCVPHANMMLMMMMSDVAQSLSMKVDVTR